MSNRKHSDVLSPKMRKKAIECAKRLTGIQRPVKEHKPIVTAWEEGYLAAADSLLNILGDEDEKV